MANATTQEEQPPNLRRTDSDEIDTNSFADLLEWFLTFDERTARMRHANTEELFQWKQADDAGQGVAIYPFGSAEARFAVGAFQALAENNAEPLLKLWISDVLDALQESRKTKEELTVAYDLDADIEAFSVKRSKRLTTNSEVRLYLTSCWIEVLCTAEARFLGWVYQETYGRPFAQ